MQKRVLSLLVDNTAGVTTRVSGLFSRRGYNIDSITGGVTADERFSRITVVCSGDELILEQITNQLAKLVDVRDIKILEPYVFFTVLKTAARYSSFTLYIIGSFSVIFSSASGHVCTSLCIYTSLGSI